MQTNHPEITKEEFIEAISEGIYQAFRNVPTSDDFKPGHAFYAAITEGISQAFTDHLCQMPEQELRDAIAMGVEWAAAGNRPPMA